MAVDPVLAAHLNSAVTTLCRCWAVQRRDGLIYGFTDHDLPLEFEGINFVANGGLTAKALQQTTGLAVDNTEATGALRDVSVSEEDILAGRFDGADVRSWLVNWADPAVRHLLFRGVFGEVRQGGGAFQVELRGLTEALNQPRGKIFQKSCSAILGDTACGFDLATPGYASELAVEEIEDGRIFVFQEISGFAERWFERGTLEMLSGEAAGLTGVIKTDRLQQDSRRIELWQALRAPVVVGDLLRLQPGCDKRTETCKTKFFNFLNFRGFPDIPGDDWLLSYPVQAGLNDGGSLKS